MTPVTARDAADLIAVTLKRERNIGGVPPRRLGWYYSWQVPEDINWTSGDGTTRPGPRKGDWLGYGRSLDGLRAMLRRRYGAGVRITEPWKAAR